MIQTTAPAQASWPAVYDEMLVDWQALMQPDVPATDWDGAFATMRAEMLNLRDQSLWRSGGRTLMRALWIHHNEVLLCRGLAWLLTPDGWHGLGAEVLTRVLEALDLPADDAGRAVVVTEEARHGTRADVVVRLPAATILFEAKVFAGEQPAQTDRLAAEWQDEQPTLVFLTRDGALPTTAVESAGQWLTMTWRQLATIATDAAATGTASHGAWDFIETLREYGG